MAGAVLAAASGRTHTIGNYPVWIGSGDADELNVVTENFAMGSAALQLPGNDVTIDEVYLVNALTNQSVQLTIGGLTSYTMVSGEAFVKFDTVLPAAFGLSRFIRDTAYFIRYHCHVAANALKWCKHNFSPPYAQFGMYSKIYDPAVTTITNMNGSGDFTFTGTAPTNDRFMSFKLCGKFVSGDPLTYGGVGDSIMENVGDRVGSAIQDVVAGFFSKALFDVIRVSGARGGINFGLNGGLPGVWSSGAATLNQYLKLCNTFIEEYGTNNFPTVGQANSGTVTFQRNAITALWLQILTNAPVAGGQPIRLGRTRLGPRTTTAWANADGSDQGSYGPQWESNGDVESLMESLEALIGTANSPQTLINFDPDWRLGTVKDTPDYYRWKAPSRTTDGTHPAPTAANDMAARTRLWMAAREAEAA